MYFTKTLKFHCASQRTSSSSVNGFPLLQ